MLENVQWLSKDGYMQILLLEHTRNKRLKIDFFPLYFWILSIAMKASLPSFQLLLLSICLDCSDLHKAKPYILCLSVLLEAIQLISFIKSINKTFIFLERKKWLSELLDLSSLHIPLVSLPKGHNLEVM